MLISLSRFPSVSRQRLARALLALLPLGGCANYSGAGDSLDRAANAQALAQQEGRKDFDCPSAQAGDAVNPVRENDWRDGLFSNYVVPVKGCGRQGNYLIVCREGIPCSVAE